MAGREAAKIGLIQAVLALNALVMLYPIVVMVLSGFKTTGELYASPFALPQSFALRNFATIWEQTQFPRYFLNSVLVTSASVGLTLVVATMAAYALARYRFALNEPIYFFILSCLMIPLKLAIIPLFVQLRNIGLIDTHLGLILIYVAMGLPASVFILTGFLRTLPSELEDSARIDGASEARILWTVMLPLTRPALVIAGIHQAVPVWNDFFFPLVFLQNDRLKTLPQGLTVFMGEYNTEWGVLFAGLTLASLPLILVYIVLSKHFIAGMTQGALK